VDGTDLNFCPAKAQSVAIKNLVSLYLHHLSVIIVDNFVHGVQDKVSEIINFRAHGIGSLIAKEG